jgi:hypothetical protein
MLFTRVFACLAILSAMPSRAHGQGAPDLPAPDPRRGDPTGDASVFIGRYLAFRSRQLASANPDVLTIRLGQASRPSRSFIGAAGILSIDLQTGDFTVSLRGLTAGQTFTLLLVDEGATAADDRTLPLATIAATGPTANVRGRLAASQVAGFAVDQAILTRGASATDVVASGSVSVLQKVFFRRLGLAVEGAPARSFEETASPPPFASLLPEVEAPLAGTPARSLPLDVLIRRGSRLFSTATFRGNGRTCATCHPASNNFTIDVPFIASLPSRDPLFVAEFNPALAQLERPQLMRQFGLILENLDGLEDPANKFVMRGVPHTLGLPVSLQQDTSLAGGPAEMTGWSGDGAPGAGALRDFATGAVTQHFTRSLERVPGRDFVLPRSRQLDAMEAFQLSLGRDADFDLSRITFLDGNVETGKQFFLNGTGNPLAGGRCNACHGNGGALAANGQNRNFNTNVEDRVHPARAVENFPIDGGFGQTPANPDGSFGNRTFNTASVVEAADTAPFFHNNVVETLEDVVRFYGGPEFNAPRAPSAQFSFDETQVGQLAGFMRGINTLQNIDLARRELEEILALQGSPRLEVQPRLQSALLDTSDAIRVLGEGGIFPSAATQLVQARQLIAQAQQTANPPQRRALIEQAIAALDGARGMVATVSP